MKYTDLDVLDNSAANTPNATQHRSRTFFPIELLQNLLKEMTGRKSLVKKTTEPMPHVNMEIQDNGFKGELCGSEEGWVTIVEMLVSNALKWARDSGQIQIRCKLYRHDENTRMPLPDSYPKWPNLAEYNVPEDLNHQWHNKIIVELLVSDDGYDILCDLVIIKTNWVHRPGIATGKRHLLFSSFEPLDTTLHRDNKSGLGLGLSLVKRHTDAQNGIVTFSSLAEKDFTDYEGPTGSTFLVRLPYDEATPTSPPKRPEQFAEEWEKNPAYRRMLDLLPQVMPAQNQGTQGATATSKGPSPDNAAGKRRRDSHASEDVIMDSPRIESQSSSQPIPPPKIEPLKDSKEKAVTSAPVSPVGITGGKSIPSIPTTITEKGSTVSEFVSFPGKCLVAEDNLV